MWRIRVFRFACTALSIILAVVACELGWRLLKFKRFTIQAGIDDPHFHHRLKSNTTYHFASPEFSVDVRTNSYSLRGPDPVIPKPPGVLRILMLGDSFTFGFPVRDEETFSFLVERGLKAQGYPVEVINGGVSGYSPVLEYLSLRDQFLRFDPDLVVLWYDRADLQDDALFEKNLLYDAQGRIARADPRYIHGRFDWWGWVQAHSVIAEYVQRKFVRTFNTIRILGIGGYVKTILRGERAKVAIARLKREQDQRDLPFYDRFLMIRETTTPELLNRYWSISAKYLRMIRDLLAERDIPFVLGTYPYGVTVGPDQWAEGRVYWGFERGKVYDSTVARNLFRQFAAGERIPFIRTFQSFREAAKTAKLYYDHDGHFTPAGQRVIADVVLNDPQFLTVLRQQLAHRMAKTQ